LAKVPETEGDFMADRDLTILYICTTCKVTGESNSEGHVPSGQRLFERVRDIHAPDSDVPVQPMVCLANCDQACSAAVSAPGKWSFILGFLTPDRAADLLEYGRAYANSEKGIVLRKERPESLRHSIVARIPSPELFKNEAAQVELVAGQQKEEAAE
jgi:predicted metal-binding protein